jgi:hypothetical protein
MVTPPMMAVKLEVKMEYLAILPIGAGGSYGRGETPEAAADRCAKIAVADWSSLYDMHGKTVKMSVYDISAHPDVWWDDQVHPKGQPDVVIPRHSIQERTLNVPPRLRRKKH